MSGVGAFLSILLTPLLRCLSAVLAIIVPSYRIPKAPERLLRFLFANRRLNILEYLSDVYFHFGGFWFEGIIYVTDPKISKKIINKLDKGAHDYLTNSPLNSSFLGKTEKNPECRHAIATIFRKSNMEEKGRLMVNVLNKTVRKMKSQDVVNVNKITLRMALDVVGEVLFDFDLEALDGKRDALLDAVMTMVHRTYALGEIKPTSKEFTMAVKCLDTEARKILTQALESAGNEENLPNVLHKAGGFEEACDNVKLFLIAGSETTASTLPVLLHLLAKLPDLQGELQAEADEIVEKISKDASYPSPKLDSAIKELLRTYSIAPYISRRTQTDMEVENFTLPAESDIRIFSWGIHRCPFYWKDSKLYKPKRFLQSDSSEHHQSYTWIPFGAGTRICIGQHLAWTELRLAMVYFLHEFQFDIVDQTRNLDFSVDWEHAVVHPHDDVILGIKPRSF